MRIDNRTDYLTMDLRRIIQACCQADGFKVPPGAIVRIVYARQEDRISGWAAYRARNLTIPDVNRQSLTLAEKRQGCAMLLRIPRTKVNIERFIAVVRHEVGHWRNLKHRDMAGSLLDTRLFKLADHPWARGLKLDVQEASAAPTAPTRADRVKAREAHVREMLALHEARLKRQKALVVRWRERVRYYDRKAEKMATTVDRGEAGR